MILYLHGLNSSGASEKATRLRAALAPIEVLSPSYPAHQPQAAIEHLGGWLSALRRMRGTTGPCLWVGSSMGGFYGRYLARAFPVDHLVLINPALRPWELFAPFRGERMLTASGLPYEVGDALVEGSRPFGVAAEDESSPPTTLFMDQGDELIDWRIAAEVYRGRGRLYLFPGGDHAFAHLEEAVPIIRDSYLALG